MRYIIVYHISFSSGKILIQFLIHFASCRTDFSPLFLVKWRSTLMKRFPPSSCCCWSGPEQSSELSPSWAPRPCWGKERMSAGRLHLYTWHPCTATSLPSSCRCLRYFPVTSEWRTAEGWWWVTQIHSAWGSPPEHPCSPFPGSAASHRPVLVQFCFAFTGFSQWLKSEVRVMF